MTAQRVAVAGLGNAAINLHLPALASLSQANVVGGCDPSDAQRSAAGARFSFPTYATLAELLTQGRPEVVIVCAPPKAHHAICLEAFRGGAHVLCEKPLATSVAQADDIIAAAAASGRRLALNHEFREMPAFRAILDAVRADRDGVVFAQAWQNMDLPPWAEPGWRGQLLNGVLYEAGIHLVDFVIAAFGETPVAVSATMSSCGTREEQTDAVALVTMEFSRGRLAQVTQNRLCKGETQYFEVRVDTPSSSHRVSYGGRARVSMGLLRSKRPHVRVEMGAAGMAWREEGHARHTLASNPGNAPMVATRNLIDATLTAFRTGGDAPASGEAGRDTLRVLAAAYISAQDGRRVRTDEAAVDAHVFEG
ncbi:MAG: Gfo/Idh/MocA family oxidoreductase [Gemmatimonadaceae bacterium]